MVSAGFWDDRAHDVVSFCPRRPARGRPVPGYRVNPEQEGGLWTPAMRAQGELTMAQIVRTFGVGRSTLYENLDLTAEHVNQLDKAA